MQLFSMNIELTNKCPLKCPQCYCSLAGDKHIDFEIAKSRIKEAAEHGVKAINMSGGETLCYPWICELIAYASNLVEKINIAVSGAYFTEAVLRRLIKAGVTSISVSLNGSTEEINRLTRDGYALAINAIKILGKSNIPNTFINWVMHSNNCDDFPNIVSIAEENNISSIDVIMFKPDSKYELRSYPTGLQMKWLADYIRQYRGPVKISVETCFSQMLALINNYSWLGNVDMGEFKGCRAGRYLYSISVDGYYSPCRHFEQYERYANLDEYLATSTVIKRLNEYENDVRTPCNKCAVQQFCRPCPAIPVKLQNEYIKGQESCQVWKFVR